jgi:hypothetical protein
MISNMSRRRKAAQADGSGEYSARKQELLQIAARVFRSQGYDRTTLGDIASAAGTERAEGVIGMLMWSSQWFDPEKSRYSGEEIGEAFADFF